MATVLILLMVVFALFTIGAAFRLVDGWRKSSGQDLLSDLEGELEELQDLAVIKARLLRDIKDLEFDHQTGHLSVEDYRDLRRRMEEKAIRVLKRLEELRGNVDYDALIDKEYALRFEEPEPEPKKRKKKRPQAAKPAREPSKSPERKKKSKPAVVRPRPVKVPSGGFCTGCGTGLSVDSRFCQSCGKSVETQAAEIAAVPVRAVAGGGADS